MALTQKLLIRQSQALVMTPQLMQAIKLLQLSHLDLAAYVEGELERNPLLERASDGEPAPDPGEAVSGPTEAAEASAGEAGSSDNSGADRIDDSLETSRSAIEERLGTDLENEFPDDGAERTPRPGAEAPSAPSEWAGTGSGGREDSD